ncbi:HNH endonuclease signature motif containing protein [Aspergillus mulundensis]|uniref:HNH nuclease domain-containing protein n=1 Tax=Aspergillus mulundensis TaxID=1810919 RepID=A0A3D8SWG6_9EURO|nr:hypothetical protein DSM5745_02428 [Aspergillus mulundensis]RDW90653.1 hypothetical protein DSM5745_02428 [Aspergillus mulundensis]
MPSFEAPDPHQIRNAYIFAANGDHLGGKPQSTAKDQPPAQGTLNMPGTPGLYINTPPQISNSTFYRLCTHFIEAPIPPEKWSIHPITPSDNFGSAPLPRSSTPLQKGRYVFLAPNVQLIEARDTDEPPLHRLYTPESFSPVSRTGSPRDPRHLRFGERVLERDRGCVVTGMRDPPPEKLRGVRATHVFPLCLRELWGRNGWGVKWMKPEKEDDEEPIGPDRLYSSRNGILLDGMARCWLCAFCLTVDPDDDYHTLVLCKDTCKYSGRCWKWVPEATGGLRAPVEEA